MLCYHSVRIWQSLIEDDLSTKIWWSTIFIMWLFHKDLRVQIFFFDWDLMIQIVVPQLIFLFHFRSSSNRFWVWLIVQIVPLPRYALLITQMWLKQSSSITSCYWRGLFQSHLSRFLKKFLPCYSRGGGRLLYIAQLPHQPCWFCFHRMKMKMLATKMMLRLTVIKMEPVMAMALSG